MRSPPNSSPRTPPSPRSGCSGRGRSRTRCWPRIAASGQAAVELARALAVLESAPLRHCAQLAGLDLSSAATAADALATEHVLQPGARLRFLHPIMRTAVYEDLAEHRRAAAHTRAARILDAEATEPEATAGHLLLAEPARDPWAVDRLQDAANQALVRGAPPSAIAFLRRALREPPLPGRRAALLLQLGQALALVGDREALSVLTEAVALAPEPAARVEAAERLASALFLGGDMDRAVTVLEDTADAIAEVDHEARYRVQGALFALSANSDPMPPGSRPGSTGSTCTRRERPRPSGRCWPEPPGTCWSGCRPRRHACSNWLPAPPPTFGS